MSAGEEDLIPSQLAVAVADAYRLYREYQHRIRLDGADKTRIVLDQNPEMMAARDAVSALWLKIFQAPSSP